MKHYGDITKINGKAVPSVDIITFGAPCQDLSIAGKRAGMKHQALGNQETTRSGLFFEAIRIIKEMRENDRQSNKRADDDIRPRFAIYENVPGAFSSNRGEDFRAVFEETAKIADENATIPRPTNGKWAPAGCILADRWSIAWRVHDAQFWGVPQRRKRICVLADFDGQTAGTILFELQRKTDDPEREQAVMDTREESRSEVQSVGKGMSRDTEESGKEREETTGTNDSSTEKTIYWLQGNGINRDVKNGCGGRGWRQNECYTLNTIDVPALIIFDPRSQDGVHRIYENVFPTLNTAQGGQRQPCISNGAEARRITPKEAERMQGFPDHWTDIGEWVDSKGKKHKGADSPRYKALGNSIALPFWQWMAERIVAVLKADGVEKPTMGSLFDGIGGFPLVFSRVGCDPIWASEIEDFPIAVTKKRFKEEQDVH